MPSRARLDQCCIRRCSRLVRLLSVTAFAAVPTSIARSQSPEAPRAAQAQARALKVEDFYSMRSVGAPLISPDGKWVAFTVTTRIEATNTDPSEVWLAATDGSRQPARVSADGMHATAPRWGDDGSLQFEGDRVGWTLDPAVPARLSNRELPAVLRGGGRGGEVRLVHRSGAATAILRDAPPPARADAPLTDFEQRHESRFKGVAFDWLNFQRDGQPFPLPNAADPAVNPAQELWLSRDGSERQLTRLGLRPQGLQWNSAGTQLLFTADSAYHDERRYGASEVYLATTDGTVRALTHDRTVQHTNAAFSPDGRFILFTRQLSTDAVIAQTLDHGGPTDLAIVPVGGGEPRILTADWDYLPAGATWSPDSRYVYFTGGIGGGTHLFRVPVAGGAVEQVTRGERRINGVSFDRAFTTIAYTIGRIEAPPDVYVARIDGSNERRLTALNDDMLAGIALSRAERLQFASADGTPVEGWLMLPFGYRADSGSYPLVVSNHGGPHAADGYAFDFKAQYLAANGYFVLKVNFRSSTGYGEKFLWGTWGGWGTRDGEDVMAGIDYAIARYPIDRSQVATMGHSYGGFMTNWLITQYPDRFAAAIPGAGIVNWVSDYGTADIARTKETEFYGTPWDPKAREIMIRQSPLSYADKVKAPTLFIHGEVDQRVPYSEAEQMYVALKKNGVPTKMIQYEGMPHSISGSWNQVHRMLNERRWLDQWLKKSPGVS